MVKRFIVSQGIMNFLRFCNSVMYDKSEIISSFNCRYQLLLLTPYTPRTSSADAGIENAQITMKCTIAVVCADG